MTPVPDRWTFERDGRSFVVLVSSRLVVNTAEAAIDAALAGLGPTCVLSYMVDTHVRAGRLERILGAFEPPAVPVLVDRAVEALRATVGASTA